MLPSEVTDLIKRDGWTVRTAVAVTAMKPREMTALGTLDGHPWVRAKGGAEYVVVDGQLHISHIPPSYAELQRAIDATIIPGTSNRKPYVAPTEGSGAHLKIPRYEPKGAPMVTVDLTEEAS